MKYREFNREIWTRDIFFEDGADAFPIYPCSSCDSMSLKMVPNTCCFWPDAETKKALEFLDEESCVYHFKTQLQCGACGEFHHVLGFGEIDVDFDHDGEEIFDEGFGCQMPTRNVLRLHIQSFFPASPIISLPEKEQGEGFYQLLRQSFSLFWLDLDACANKIRSSVEYLLDHEIIHVERWQGAQLQQRIEKLKSSHPDLFVKFMALKELGNAGSHELSSLKKKDLMDAYQVVDNVIYEIFIFPEIEKMRQEKRDKASVLAGDLTSRLEKKKVKK